MVLVTQYLKLIRIHHWVKNLFFFLPIFFSGKFLAFDLYYKIVPGFLLFCFTSSFIYVLNDIRDFELDQLHPEKKFRPLASGKITTSKAYLLLAMLLGLAILSAFFVNTACIAFVASYFILNILYSFGLKNIAIIDVAIIALGFVFRVMCGGVLTDIEVSKWLMLMTFLLALFLALAKRRDDVLIFNERGEKMRKSISGYNLQFLDTSLAMLCAIIIVCYISYTNSPEVVAHFGTDKIYLTTFFVIIGLLRYLQISLVEKKSSSPTKILLKDLFLQVVVVSWFITFVLLLYFKQTAS